MPDAPSPQCLPDLRQAGRRAFRPFCSQRCADVDLNRWLSGVYAVPVTEDEEEDERRDLSGEAAQEKTASEEKTAPKISRPT